jgi:hypothetical protein
VEARLISRAGLFRFVVVGSKTTRLEGSDTAGLTAHHGSTWSTLCRLSRAPIPEPINAP